MPTDDMSASSSVQTITGETVSLYYSNSGTRTIDAGQAAGTAVVGQLAFKNILDADGSRVATFNDTSFSFTGNCFTTERKYPGYETEDQDFDTWANKLSAVTSGFANGEYCVDYRSGTVYGVKATTTSSLTSTTYKINQAQAGGSVALPAEVQVEGQAAEDAAASGNPVLSGGRYDSTARTLDNGDVGAVALDAAGNQQVVGEIADDAVDSGNPISIGGIARSAQRTAVAALDRVKATFNTFGELVIAGYTWATNSIRVEEIDPVSSHYVKETITHTNVANATPEFGYISMDGYRGCTIHVEKTGGTDTFDVDYEASNEGATSSDDWIDITTNGFQLVGGANLQSDHFVSLDIDVCPVGLRYEITTAGGSDDADFQVFVRKWW